jgi:hypothetical protein
MTVLLIIMHKNWKIRIGSEFYEGKQVLLQLWVPPFFVSFEI